MKNYETVFILTPVLSEDQMKDTVQKYHIPRIHLDDLIAGMEDDFFQDRYETFEDLYRYCYRVASTVGLVCIDIYGYENPKARRLWRSREERLGKYRGMIHHNEGLTSDWTTQVEAAIAVFEREADSKR